MSYSSELIQQAVCNQLTSIAAQSGNMEELQSACREHHSTVTAILKVKWDLLTAMDNKEVTCLVLLDLSATFDTVNHKLLLNILNMVLKYGIDGTIIQWIESYLTNCIKRVKVDDHESDQVTFTFRVPKGSVLRPIFFILYTFPLGDICKKFGIYNHCYPDDTQVYVSFKPIFPSNQSSCICNLENCIAEYRNGWEGTSSNWMMIKLSSY